jgi:bifunctional UDP-N-acetylglucosamine pyrophosphorylase/glucosamine-1-phosphate N-acetyltransferase
MNLNVVILAAGEGKRINSYESKVLMKVAHKHMVDYVLDAAADLATHKVVLVASESNLGVLQDKVSHMTMLHQSNSSLSYSCTVQHSQQGTGHAARVGVECMSSISNSEKSNTTSHEYSSNGVLFLYGDTPLINADSIKNALRSSQNADVVVFGMDLDDIRYKNSKYTDIISQNNYGRVFFDENDEVVEICEKCDLSDDVEQKKCLCNSGIMYLSQKALKLLSHLPSHKTQHDNLEQYYLTDVVKLAKNAGLICKSVKMSFDEMVGVNSKEELAFVESIMQNKLRKKHMQNGAILLNPESIYFSHDTQVGKDAIIYPNVFFEENVVIHDKANVLPFSFLSDCVVYENASVGPFVTLRNSVDIHPHAHIGNFVEIKNACIEESVKIKHLSYVGDAHISEKSNIGAGVIFCNFDGVNKNYSFVGKNVFIGSNSSIVAPISLGKDSIVAAGSVVTQDMPENSLSVTRAKQKNILQGASRYKNLKKSEKKGD